MSNHKSYITIKTSAINSVNFAEVIEEKSRVRKSVDGLKFIVKWKEGSPFIPESIVALPTADKGALMTHAEALLLMDSPEWSVPMPI